MTQWKPNVTVAAVIEQDNHYLMVEEIDGGRPVLNQPAGHLEAGECLLNAVRREVMEETAHEFTPQYLTGIYLYTSETNGITYLRFCFGGQCKPIVPAPPLDKDIERTLWLTWEQLESRSGSLRSPLVISSISDYLSGQRYPLSMLQTIDSVPQQQLR